MIIPYQVDVPMSRWPIANFGIIGVTLLAALAFWSGSLSEQPSR